MSESSVILKTPNDWDAWNKQFRAEAKQKDLLAQVDRTASFHTKPVEPELQRFLPQRAQTHLVSTATAMEDSTPEESMADLTTEG